jgi:hypothetical protein
MDIQTETKIYIGAAILFPLITAIVCAIGCLAIDVRRFWLRRRIHSQKSYVDKWEAYVDHWDIADENHPGCYTDRAQKHRETLAREQAKLSRLMEKLE